MDGFEYIRNASRSESTVGSGNITDGQIRLLHAALGLHTETGEFSDMLKRHIFYGARLDRVNALEEIGDALWYMAIVLVHFDTSFEKVMAANVAKLQWRYPDQFNSVMAITRDLDTEREVLEAVLAKDAGPFSAKMD